MTKEQQDAHVFMVCMAWDAFYLCIGKRPKRHGVNDVVRWIRAMADLLDRKEA